MGGSYGGYETLAALAFTPDVFACGVDVVGPSDLETFIANIPPYWSFEHVTYRLGDPRTPEGVALLRERSPIRKVDQIKASLLIGQGANDVRVRQAQSDSIARRLDERGVKVTYALYPDEGHGFLRPENNAAFFRIAEVFLQQCLGGRAMPITAESLKGSSIQLPVGARHIPGLEEALRPR
jgi:dipeptidyl aminopeptidase/acylaminoacyl peptidase